MAGKDFVGLSKGNTTASPLEDSAVEAPAMNAALEEQFQAAIPGVTQDLDVPVRNI